MFTSALLVLLLTQAGEAAGFPVLAVVELPDTTLAPAETPLPVMDPDELHQCVLLAPTPQVPSGRYRAQCDITTLRCLAAPDTELEVDRTESTRPLERAYPCLTLSTSDVRRADARYTFVPAVADSPAGWYRDERGRVMQFNFDLHRRVWLGGGWSPLWRDGEPRALPRGRVDFGITAEVPNWNGRRMHRITALETELVLGQQGSLDATLLRYDTNNRPEQPTLRVSTFVGGPRRFDLGMDLGTWLEVLRLEQVRRGGVDSLFYTLLGGHLTLDVWHSADLASYVRVRAGPSIEYDRTNHFFTLVPGAVVEGDLTLDANGFHHLTAALEVEKLFLGGQVAGRPDSPERLRVRAGYEVILLTLNDQPVSLVLEGRGQWRSDLSAVPAVWEWSAHSGLRFSLWAPARRSARLMASR